MKVSRIILSIVTLMFAAFELVWLVGFPLNLTIILLLLLLWGLLAQLLAWAARHVSAKVWTLSGCLILLSLLIPTSSLMAYRPPGLFTSLTQTSLFLLPSLALINSALLLSAGLTFFGGEKANESIRSSKPLGVVALSLMSLLLIKTLHNLYNLTLWDSTYDPLGYLWLVVPLYAALLAALMLSAVLPQSWKLVSLVYVLLIPAALITVSTVAQHVNYRQVTRQRAERTVQAIEAYYGQEGQYPETLAELLPWYLLSLPRPMIIYGQDWCYERGKQYYRLGYLDRQHWSDPRLIGRIYKVEGIPANLRPMCWQEFNAMRNNRSGYPYRYWKEVQ